MIQVLTNPGGEDFLVGLFILLTLAIALVTIMIISLTIEKFGTNGLILILPGIFAVLLTGSILTYTTNSSFYAISYYGLPLPWWEVTSGRNYEMPVAGWIGFFFLLDGMLFALAGYLVATTYVWIHHGKPIAKRE